MGRVWYPAVQKLFCAPRDFFAGLRVLSQQARVHFAVRSRQGRRQARACAWLPSLGGWSSRLRLAPLLSRLPEIAEALCKLFCRVNAQEQLSKHRQLTAECRRLDDRNAAAAAGAGASLSSQKG